MFDIIITQGRRKVKQKERGKDFIMKSERWALKVRLLYIRYNYLRGNEHKIYPKVKRLQIKEIYDLVIRQEEKGRNTLTMECFTCSMLYRMVT